MTAAMTDLITKVGLPGTMSTLTGAGKQVGVDSMGLSTPANFPTETAAIFCMQKVNITTGEPLDDSYTVWKGIINGSSVDEMELKLGNDQEYPAGVGTQVFIYITTTWANSLIDGILTSLNPNGTMKTAAVKAALGNDGNLVQVTDDLTRNGVIYGGAWTSTGLVADMTNGVAYINGIRVPFNGTTKTLPASRNTYAYLNPDGSVQYLDTALGAAEPTAPSGTLLITGISTNATAVTANTSYNRGITGAEAIDYASFYGLNGLPAAQTGLPFITKTLNIGYGMTARLVREGNVVSLSVNTVTSQGVPSLDIQNLTETIPLGFRPRATTDAQMFGGAVIGGSGTRMGWTVNSAGAMQFSNTTATSGSMRVYASAAWITRDPFPAS